MKKLVRGILEFRQKGFPAYRETFAKLAAGQSPDALFVSCSDSRVVPNLFASTHPGELFVVRNVGNMIPPGDDDNHALGDTSEASAVEYAMFELKVRDIIVCGHSSCGAMKALCAPVPPAAWNLASWLKLGDRAVQRLKSGEFAETGLPEQDRLSQINVLQQLEHLRSYPMVSERIATGEVRLHAWWFDIHAATVHDYREDLGRFVPIDEVEGERILQELGEGSLKDAMAEALG
ncbi:MAG TPA: carbonic anhydrase [Myxococcaceae bacterium]|nr:carbonic anhydrase [Myxococcaceae bacterium]